MQFSLEELKDKLTKLINEGVDPYDPLVIEVEAEIHMQMRKTKFRRSPLIS